jgi:thiol-disulfide isomerase/thioredoxin
MTNKIKVILAKASWCPHCTHFMPIYEKAKEDYEDEYEFSCYDFADDAPNPNRSNFENDHGELVDLVDGYPTIFLKKDNKTYTKIDPTIIRDNDKNKAVKEFKNNIENGKKTLESDRKEEHITLEGGSSLNEDIYKNKYMKYKEKYFRLKNNLK